MKPTAILRLCLLCLLPLITACSLSEQPPVKVGILFSQTGTMATSETPLIDATLMAIDEINLQGGLLGRQIEPVILDAESDWNTITLKAHELCEKHRVSAIFGCWTSACRKSIKPVIEANDNLLFYPVQYEGLEASDHIIYLGSTPNQQIAPAIHWAYLTLGKNFFMVGSDYVFPRAAAEQIQPQLSTLKASLLGESFVPLGSTDFAGTIREIQHLQPDVIINTLNGSSNSAFFDQLHTHGLQIPTLSFSISEPELEQMNRGRMTGHYAAWSYFQSLDTPENQRFVADFQKRFGANRVTSAAVVAAYSGMHLWASAVKQANSVDPKLTRHKLKGKRFDSPEGIMTISSLNNHTWKNLHIGQARDNGQFDIVWSSREKFRPQPFPPYRTVNDWQQFLNSLHQQWGRTWTAPVNWYIDD